MNILQKLYFRGPDRTPIHEEENSTLWEPTNTAPVRSTTPHLSLADFGVLAEGTTPSEKREEMQAHMDSGCDVCMKTREIWRQVMVFAENENSYAPPEAALRIVQSYFNPLRIAAAKPENFEIAKLAFDSFQRPGMADLRGQASAVSRQLLYKCGTICIDIRLEPKPGSNFMVLVGQVIDAKEPLSGAVDVSVSLVGPGSTLSETTTNQFGEFYFGFQSAKHMQLFVGMRSRGLVVPLPETRPEAA